MTTSMIDEKGTSKMKSYRRSSFRTYSIQFYTKQQLGQKNRIDVQATSVEDAVNQFNEEASIAFPNQDVIEIISITCAGKRVSKKVLDLLNSQFIAECDAGATGGGGDAGGMASGDAGASAGDTAGEMAGTTSAEVLGNCDHVKDGYMGPGCVHIPSRVKVPLNRWEAAYGGSKRKKTKKGKDKKYAYEKGMKVVVDMLEDETLPDASGIWTYCECLLDAEETLDENGYDLNAQIVDDAFLPKMKTDVNAMKPYFANGQMCIDFQTKKQAVEFAIKRLEDFMTLIEDNSIYYASQEDWEAEAPRYKMEELDAKRALKNGKDFCSITDGRNDRIP